MSSKTKSKSKDQDEKIKKIKKVKKTKKQIDLFESSEGGADLEKEEIDDLNVPTVVEMPKIESNIFETEGSIKFSTNLDYPRSEYGFHHFIHNNKNKTEKLSVFDGKKKVYLVFNRFDKNIDNHVESINNVSKKFFSNGKQNYSEILDDDFYKLWETLTLFDIIDTSEDNFSSLHLGENTGSFIQTCIYFRDMYCKKNISKNDKYYNITTNPDDVGGKDHVKSIDESFQKFYKNRIIQQNYKDKKIDDKASFITSNLSIDWVNLNIQEQEAYRQLISQITTCIKFQKKGGSFVCKFFETFTKTSLKIISILMATYEKVQWYKPLTSDFVNSEKYVICTGFKFSEKDKEHKEILKKMEDLLKKIYNDKTNKIVDIFIDYEIPKDLIISMIDLNVKLSNKQLKNIGEIISFVDKEIYSGDEYHDRKDEQIKGAKFWISVFLPETETQNKNIKKELLNIALNNSNKQITYLKKHLVHVENQN